MMLNAQVQESHDAESAKYANSAEAVPKQTDNESEASRASVSDEIDVPEPIDRSTGAGFRLIQPNGRQYVDSEVRAAGEMTHRRSAFILAGMIVQGFRVWWRRRRNRLLLSELTNEQIKDIGMEGHPARLRRDAEQERYRYLDLLR